MTYKPGTGEWQPAQTGNPVDAAAATVAAPVMTAVQDAPAGGVGAAAGGWDTAGHRDTAIATINELRADVTALIAALKAAGVLT